MSQQFFPTFDSALLVRDAQGRYLPATTDQILQAARHAVEQKLSRGTEFTSPTVVKEYLTAKLSGFDVEVFAVLFLDSQHRLIEYVEMFQGTLSQASVYPREVAKAALNRHAAAVIVAHNHPSGTLTASSADSEVTQRLEEAGVVLGIKLVDHLIVSSSGHLSIL